MSSASIRSLPFYPLLCPSLHETFPWYRLFSWRNLWSFPFCCFPLFLCIVHLRRASYLSLLFSVTLHLVRCIFPFFPRLLLLFFHQLFVKPFQTTTLPSCISFSWWWFWSLPPLPCYESIFLQALCLSDLIPWIYLTPPLYNHKGFDLGHT